MKGELENVLNLKSALSRFVVLSLFLICGACRLEIREEVRKGWVSIVNLIFVSRLEYLLLSLRGFFFSFVVGIDIQIKARQNTLPHYSKPSNSKGCNLKDASDSSQERND